MAENGGGKRPRLDIGAENFPFLINFDGFADDSSDDDSSYHPDKGELQEFQRESEAKVTKLIKTIRENEISQSEFQKILVDRIQAMQTDRDLLITEIRFAIANAVQFKKRPFLDTLLSACPNLLPDILAGPYPLLNFAIKTRNADAVKTLLDHGANRLSDFSQSSLDAVISAIEDAFDYEYFNDPTAKSFLEIFRLLLDFKVDLMKCPRLTCQIASIASRSSEIASLLLEKTPGQCYFPFRHEGKLQPSALFLAFENLNSWDSINTLENSLRFGILAMLKCGAPLVPIDDMLRPDLPPAQNLIAIDRKCSRILWKQPFSVVRIVLEARQTSALKIGAIKKEVDILQQSEGDHFEESSNESSTEDESIEEAQQLFDFLRSQFPRRLQEICRTAIIRCLPIGHKRSESTKSLDIPPPLISYLLFNDLDLP